MSSIGLFIAFWGALVAGSIIIIAASRSKQKNNKYGGVAIGSLLIALALVLLIGDRIEFGGTAVSISERSGNKIEVLAALDVGSAVIIFTDAAKNVLEKSSKKRGVIYIVPREAFAREALASLPFISKSVPLVIKKVKTRGLNSKEIEIITTGKGEEAIFSE